MESPVISPVASLFAYYTLFPSLFIQAERQHDLAWKIPPPFKLRRSAAERYSLDRALRFSLKPFRTIYHAASLPPCAPLRLRLRCPGATSPFSYLCSLPRLVNSERCSVPCLAFFINTDWVKGAQEEHCDSRDTRVSWHLIIITPLSGCDSHTQGSISQKQVNKRLDLLCIIVTAT